MNPHEIEGTESLLRVRSQSWIMDVLSIPQPDWVMLHFESAQDPSLPSLRVLLYRTEFQELLRRMEECLEAIRAKGLVEIRRDATHGWMFRAMPMTDPGESESLAGDQVHQGFQTSWSGDLASSQGFGHALNHENTGTLIVGYDLRYGQHGVELVVWPIHRRGLPNFLWAPEEALVLLGRLHEIGKRLFPDT